MQQLNSLFEHNRHEGIKNIIFLRINAYKQKKKIRFTAFR